MKYQSKRIPQLCHERATASAVPEAGQIELDGVERLGADRGVARESLDKTPAAASSR